MLAPAGLMPVALEVVRSHHERLDGSGYPQALAGDDVHEFARIAAIADTYDAITSDRPYQGGRPPHVALYILRADVPAKYDAGLLDTFVHVALPFPVGSEVPVPGGGTAVVAGAGPLGPWQPLVRLPSGAEATLDLRHLDWSRAAALRR